MSPDRVTPWSRRGLQLFAIGFLTLFLELALIRYLAGNVWNLGYFPNLVLVSVFVGMGVGFTFHQLAGPRASSALLHAGAWLLLALTGLVQAFRPAVPGFGSWSADFGGELFFTAVPAEVSGQGYAPFAVCTLLIVLAFACLSQRTAKLFASFRPLTAYTLDIAGSCAGILVFMAMSWMSAPAWVWFLLVAAMLVVVAADRLRTRWIVLLPGSLVALIAWQQDQRLLADPAAAGPVDVRWSPYQKIEYVDVPAWPKSIFVNGVLHQQIKKVRATADRYYQAIHTHRARSGSAPYRRVLVLGAGCGNDVAAALLNGAHRVDAVEIDPVLAEIGRERNPASPYRDPRVNLVVDDGRAFLARAEGTYDLILFALTDSLVKVSSMSQLRLENYLFTVESVQRAWHLLAPDGDIVLYNFYRQSWLRERIEALVARATGRLPRVIFAQGDFAALSVRKREAEPGAATGATSITIPTDDWPFLYLRERRIPSVYRKAMVAVAAFVAALLLLLHLMTRRDDRRGARGLGPLKVAFLIMGASFLLLESKGVIQFSLLFGTSWVNSSLVFLAVLVLAMLANWTAALLTGPRLLLFATAFLVGSTVLGMLIPLASLLQIESTLARFAVASLLTFSPIFFANLLFSVAMRDLVVAEHVFGWNLIGATLGCVAEYLSMGIGYARLSVVVAACYAAVFALCMWSRAMRTRAVAT